MTSIPQNISSFLPFPSLLSPFIAFPEQMNVKDRPLDRVSLTNTLKLPIIFQTVTHFWDSDATWWLSEALSCPVLSLATFFLLPLSSLPLSLSPFLNSNDCSSHTYKPKCVLLCLLFHKVGN